MKIIFDTDIGDDIDDALALDLALKLGYEIIGVTTVFKNTEFRARIAKKLLKLYGRQSVPVYAGWGDALQGSADEEEIPCQFTEDILRSEYAPDGGKDDAVDFLVECAEKYGGDLTIIAIGPLTNMARAVMKNAKAMRGVGQILLMGGDYVNQYSEWNILCDVDAAKIVYEADLPLVCFGHELTSRTQISPEQQAALFSLDYDGYSRYLAELSRLWYKSKEAGHLVILHDVITAYYAAHKEYFKTRETLVKVESLGEVTRGMTVNLSVMCHYDLNKAHPVRYAVCEKAEAFADLYFDLLKGGEK